MCMARWRRMRDVSECLYSLYGWLLLFLRVGICDWYFMSVFLFCSGSSSFGKGGTPDSHGLLGKEFGKKIFFCIVVVVSKFVLRDYILWLRFLPIMTGRQTVVVVAAAAAAAAVVVIVIVVTFVIDNVFGHLH